MLAYIPYSGCLDGSITLWLVDYSSRVEPSSGEGVEEERWGVKLSTVATLSGHQAPLTSLQFTHYTASLLASGCRGGSVRIWDVQVIRVSVTSSNHSSYSYISNSKSCVEVYLHLLPK